ncbi:MAG: hypothetical protein WDN27_02035 [Candidatus Saccharibacteria bacterium]
MHRLLTTGTAAYLDTFGADPTGTAFSDAALASAISGGYKAFIFGIGTYKFANNYTWTTNVSIKGQGKAQTKVNFTGQGDFLRLYRTSNFVTAGAGPEIIGFAIDGSGAINGASDTAPTTALHYGDWLNGIIDITVANFSASHMIGVWLDNQHLITEDSDIKVHIDTCTIGVCFDIYGNRYPGSDVYGSGNTYNTGFVVSYNGYIYRALQSVPISTPPTGAATSNSYWTYLEANVATSSFDYSSYEFYVGISANQTAIVLRNGARIDGATKFYIRVMPALASDRTAEPICHSSVKAFPPTARQVHISKVLISSWHASRTVPV